MKILARTLVSFLLLTYAAPSFGQWSGNPATNTPISIAPSYQDLPQLISDGSGGAIITWADWRNPPTNLNGDIYAQRIGANGFVQWTVDGVSVCSNAITQNRPQIVSDGSGGAIIVWEDLRNGGTNDIYAQRINSSGAAQWATNGIPVCAATAEQSRPMIVTDGAGGAIITWYDRRTSGQFDIYAQRIVSSGGVQWATNGIALCPATTNQIDPKIITDGAGGAIVVWTDNRNNVQNDIYAQRINANGGIQWSTSGLAICVARRQQNFPSIAPDGSGGAIIAWSDNRDSLTLNDIFVQRVDSNGNRLWAPDGAPVSVGAGDQRAPIVLSDMNGGAIMTWNDTRNGSSNRDIYAQRVGSSGAALWSNNGIPICTAANDQDWARPVSDGNGGAIISWEDERAGGTSRNVYAQRVNATGAVQWAANGVAISTASGYKSFSQILPVATGDGIITWADERSGSSNRDVFAQRINSNGTLTSVRLSEQTPASFSLEQNYPNPFNPMTTIAFGVGTYNYTSLRVYDVLGREVATLVNENLNAGSYEATFDASRHVGMASGVYFYRLQAGDPSTGSGQRFVQTKKLVVLQ